MSSTPYRPIASNENQLESRMDRELPQTETGEPFDTPSLSQPFINRPFSLEASSVYPLLSRETIPNSTNSNVIPRKEVPKTIQSADSPSTYSKPPDGEIYASNVALLPLPYGDNGDYGDNSDYGDNASKTVTQTPQKEWRPKMLRKVPAAVLTLTCLTMAILLEVLNIVARNRQGFSTESKTTVQVSRYLPTIAVICLGFGWKSLVTDLKIVTPYSVMSAKWSESPKSMLLDYVDSLEFMAVWMSASHRHWAMFLALSVGLLCGILVPLANALTFVNLYSAVDQHAPIVINSQFSFKDTLASQNGTLYIPWDYRGSQPYAAVASSRQPNGNNPPWTVDDFAFESLDIGRWPEQNVTIGANVQAFNAPFDCTIINYAVPLDKSYLYVNADEGDLAKANCRSPITQVLNKFWPSGEFGWLNVTDCSDNGSDIRMLATAAVNPNGNGSMVDAKAVGLLCRPKYFLRQADIRLNGSTGDILGYTLQNSPPTPIDVGAELPPVVTYLNSPLDPASQTTFLGPTAGPFESDKLPQVTLENATVYASGYNGRDPFFDQLLSRGRNVSDYLENPALLQSEVVDLSNSILTQVISSFARANVSREASGSVTLYESRLHVRKSSLRGMQAILAFMGVICGLCCTILRPKSRLTEDPAGLAAVSVILSASEKRVEQKLQEVVMSDTASTNEALSGWRWLLSSKNGTSKVEAEELSERLLASNDYAGKSGNPHVSEGNETQPPGYQPFPFYLATRAVLLLFLCGVIGSLAALLRVSNTTGGFLVADVIASAAWSLVPSTILVLLGYSISSVHGVLQSFTPYLSLRRTAGSKALIKSSHSFVLLMPFYAILRFGSIALATSSIMALIFPGVEILAAGLYVPVQSIHTGPVQAVVDTSLMDGFEAMYGTITPELGDPMVRQASQFAEWTSIPYFGVPHRAGGMGNLAFGNLTHLEDVDNKTSNGGSLISTRVPAIAVNLTCTTLGPEHFQLSVEDNWGETHNETFWQFLFSMQCATKSCNDTLGGGSRLISWKKFIKSPESTSRRYFGRASVKGYTYSNLKSLNDTPYHVILGDFATISEPFTNQTLLSSDLPVKVEPGMFNYSSPPSMVAVSCTKAYWEVDVDVKMTKNTRFGISGIETLPWSVSAYDEDSIKYKRQYNNTMPLWAYPKSNYINQYNQDKDGVLNSDTLWPARGKSTNFFELIAAHQHFQVGNLSAVTDKNQLLSAVRSAFTAYCVEMLTELRPHTALASTSTVTVPGIMSTPLTRMKQDPYITFALCALLALMLIGLLYIFITFPRERLMAKPPTSIAAQMSLLAGSSLVRQLRDRNVQSVKSTDLWNTRFRLGWWPVGGGENGGSGGWRWGIDAIGSERSSNVDVYHAEPTSRI